MARMKSSTCVQDRLRLSEALGLGDNSHRNRTAFLHRLAIEVRGLWSRALRNP
jgi:hypothetical protein